jgi:hypothetical protein
MILAIKRAIKLTKDEYRPVTFMPSFLISYFFPSSPETLPRAKQVKTVLVCIEFCIIITTV